MLTTVTTGLAHRCVNAEAALPLSPAAEPSYPPCPGPRIICIFALASNPSTWGGWWQAETQLSGLGLLIKSALFFGSFTWSEPGPWHSSHYTFWSFSFQVTVEPPGLP